MGDIRVDSITHHLTKRSGNLGAVGWGGFIASLDYFVAFSTAPVAILWGGHLAG